MKRICLLSLLCFCFFGQAQSAKISVAELPTAAKTFLNQYYKYRPVEFVRKKDETGIPYEVKLAQGTQIKFCDNGDWCQINNGNSSVPKELVPTNIATYIKEKYPKKRICYIEKDADGIEVNLNGNISLAFDPDGKLVD
ncbi:PepSY-like domain-containing protein [Flavobacterium sp.]|uniref:PepSY-like domain-containing protein n=1 Tax=Flavobacterium sp. TaxID=239 RepID=UPI0025B7C8CB|nr:PepSY-like domain-containing protein [Flavobacterium sp.]